MLTDTPGSIVPRQGWKNVSEIAADWATRTPEAAALVEGARRWTYRELDRAVRAAAEWLVGAGVRPGDRVVLVCENCSAAVALYLACARIGAWPVVVNARLSDREIDEISEHSGARRAIFTSEASLHARRHGERHRAEIAEPADFGSIMLGPLNNSADAEPGEPDRADNVAALIYTSGTTGRPKGVMLSHNNLLFVARASAKARRFSPEDRVAAILPISHILGLTGVLLGSLAAGAAVHLVSRFDPASVLIALEREELSVLLGTPSMYAMLTEFAARKGRAPIAAPRLRHISAAGAPLDAATKAAAEHAFGQTLHNGYGITECSATIALTTLGPARRDCSAGRLLPDIEARLVDQSGRHVPAGTSGELCVRGPGVMKGYYRDPLQTAEAIDEEGWFRTGDLAREEEGNFFIVGRSKEMIIRFGFNVYPAEIEGVLNAHPAVARAAVVGNATVRGEEVTAFIHRLPGARVSPAELAEYAAARLATYKRPSAFVFVETMPVSAAGKILKSALAASLVEGSKQASIGVAA